MPKRAFNKIPKHIQKQINDTNGKPFHIYAVLTLQEGDKLPNVPGLDLSSLNNPIPAETLPDPSRGTWARRNAYGWEIVRDDLPKYTKSFSFETPNFGDWSLGSHEVTIDREVYPREDLPGYGSTLLISEVRRNNSSVTLSITLNRVFPSMPDDERDFLFALNIFQESVGTSSVKATDVPAESFPNSLHVQWEILPVGDKEEVVRLINSRLRPNDIEAKLIQERMDLLLSLRPTSLITGTSGFARYVGALYSESLVVFENIRYGNAIYIMFDEWARLSKMSRVDLINSNEKFERIEHRSNWVEKVKSIIREYRYR